MAVLNTVAAIVVALFASAEVMAMQGGKPECVVLLHGLGRGANAMAPLEKALQREGYLTWNESYPSRRFDVEQLSQKALTPALDFCTRHQASKIHFVTHSLGGILVRHRLQQQTLLPVSRVVMLGPPNQGSEVAQYLRRWPLFRWVTGPAGQQLGIGAGSIVHDLQPLSVEVGVIAGTRSADPWFNFLFDAQHDGKVSVASTRLPEMNDFVALPVGHTMMMRNKAVIAQTLNFLRTGGFMHVGA